MIYGIIISLALLTVLIVSGIFAWKQSKKIEKNKDALIEAKQKQEAQMLHDQQKIEFEQQKVQKQLADVQKKFLEAQVATAER